MRCSRGPTGGCVPGWSCPRCARPRRPRRRGDPEPPVTGTGWRRLSLPPVTSGQPSPEPEASMSAYRTIVVGTDGSATSFAPVDRAAAVAGDSNAELVIVCAYTPAGRDDTAEAEDALKDEAYLVRGWTPAEE